MKKVLHNKIKLLFAFTVAIMCLGVFTSNSQAAEIVPYSQEPVGGGGDVNGEVASYNVTLTGELVVEMFMNNSKAQSYAANVTASVAEQAAWYASGVGFALSKATKTGGAYIGFMELLDSFQRTQIQTKVLALTAKGKKVHVTCYQSPTMNGKSVANYTVKEWDGKLVDFSKVSGIRALSVKYY